MCKECFIEYCKNALASRSFKEHRNYGYTLQCPGTIAVCLSVCSMPFATGHCDDSYISEIHHFRLMTTDEVLLIDCGQGYCIAPPSMIGTSGSVLRSVCLQWAESCAPDQTVEWVFYPRVTMATEYNAQSVRSVINMYI